MPEEPDSPSSALGADARFVSPAKRRVVLVYGLTAAGTIAWLAGIFLAPYLRSQHIVWANLAYTLYSPVCHQLPSRSLHAWGFPLAVCTRCLGIYLGFGAGVALYPLLRGFRKVRLPDSRAFLALSVPIVIDTAGNFLGIWASSGPLRLATGLLWGLILPFYFITGLVDLRLRRQG